MKRLIFYSLFGLSLSVVYGQTGPLNRLDNQGKKDGDWLVYYDSDLQVVPDSSQASYYRYTFYVHGKDLIPMEWAGKGDELITPANSDSQGDLNPLNGTYKILDKSGNLKSTHVFKEGRYVSYKSYYPAGSLHTYCNFENQHFERGKFEPHTYSQRVYEKNGEVKYYYMRKSNEPTWDFYRSLHDSTSMTVQKVIGDSTFARVTFYAQEQPLRQMEIIYANDHRPVLNGLYMTWYSNGQQREEVQFDHDQQMGDWKRWAKDGTPVNTHIDPDQLNRFDSQGEKTGWWIVYLDDNLKQLKDSVGATHCRYTYYTGKYSHYNMGTIGTKKSPVEFPADDTLKYDQLKLLNGDYISRYENGVIHFVLSAEQGIFTEYKEYYPNGQLKVQFIYSAGCGAPLRFCIKQYNKQGELTYDGYAMTPLDRQEN